MTRTLTRYQAVFAASLLMGLISWGALAGQSVREAPTSVNPEESDLYLYIAIAERVAEGEEYYAAAVAEQSERGYPVQPATTIRTPTTVALITAVGPKTSYGIMAVLLALSLLSAVFVYGKLADTRVKWIAAVLTMVASLALFGPLAIYFQETWAVLLIFLSLIVRGRTLAASIALALLACAFRELALPYMFAMMLFEASRRDFKAAFAWSLAGVGFLATYMLHVLAVSNAVAASGISSAGESPGWLALGGWPFIVGSTQSVTILSALPLWVSVLVVPLSLFGWSLAKSEFAQRMVFAILGFVIPFLFIGRPNNNYWALLYAALMLPGLAFSWAAIRESVRAAIGAPVRS